MDGWHGPRQQPVSEPVAGLRAWHRRPVRSRRHCDRTVPETPAPTDRADASFPSLLLTPTLFGAIKSPGQALNGFTGHPPRRPSSANRALMSWDSSGWEESLGRAAMLSKDLGAETEGIVRGKMSRDLLWQVYLPD